MISYIAGLIGFAVLILIDQFTKHLAVVRLKGQEPFVLIENVFEFHYLENQGAAFGILQGKRSFFLIITIIVLIVVLYIYIKMPADRRFLLLRVLIILIAAGALGNMIDRLRQGYVVDFFYFKLINFPVFNVADIYVTCSAIALVLAVLFYYKDADLDRFGEAMRPKRHES